MTQRIHPTAIIDPSAILEDDVEVGPYSVIGANVHIGEQTILGPHVVLEDRTILGKNCRIAAGAVLGGAPQDLAYQGELTRVRVGDNALIREYVTLNRATGEGNETVIGDNCFLMAYSHLAHNCQAGDHVIMANAVQVAGHVKLGDYAFIGGGSLIHQHVVVGRMAFLGGASGCSQDLPPFSMSDGKPTTIRGVNTVGLRRRGLSSEERQRLKKAFFYLWFSGLNQTHAIQAIRDNLEMDHYLEELLDFVLSSKRGICSKHHRPGESPHNQQEVQEPESILV